MDAASELLVLEEDEYVPLHRVTRFPSQLHHSALYTPFAAATFSSVQNMKSLVTMFAGSPIKFFTFNDGWNTDRPKSADFVFNEFLQQHFPEPSQFEIPSATW
jgi:hypothetical protein